MKTSTRDLTVGGFLLLGIAAIAYLSLSLGASTYSGRGGMILYASFDELGGLAARASVVIGGVPVGEVEAITLQEDFRAQVTMNVDRTLELPDDSSATILTQGLLGNKYVALEPGGSEDLLEDGAEITYTQSATVLERLIGRLMQNIGDK